MKRSARLTALSAFLVLSFVLAGMRPVLGQDRSASTAGSAVARVETSYFLVNGSPTELMWARGLTDPADLTQYASVGFNTVYLEIRDTTPGSLERASALATAAEDLGLLVVAAVRPTALRDEAGNEVPVDPTSDAYQSAVETCVRTAVEGLGQHPRLIAWSVAAVSPGDVVEDSAGFITYLRQWYSSLSALNESWGTGYTSWGDVTAAAARDVDSGLPNGLGRASVDYAFYRESAYADSVRAWALALRANAPGRPVLVGALTDYRSIISVPTDFDGMVLATTPSVAGADWTTGNVQAVDIARRGNQFAAIQTLEVAGGTSRQQVMDWAGLALTHGAAGVAFTSWSAVKGSEELQTAVAAVSELAASESYPNAPLAQAAILYEPIAGGAVVRSRGLYGYLDGVTPGSPTNLFAAAATGTKFGLFDVLRWEDVTQVDVSQYTTIIAPMALYLPDDAQLALQNWVLLGGALVVDRGVGMYQSEGTTDSMPAIMREVLNLRYLQIGELEARGEYPTQVITGEVYDPAAPGEVYSPGEPGEVYGEAAPGDTYGQVTPGAVYGQAGGETRALAPGQTAGGNIDPALTRFVQSLELFLTRSDVLEFLGENFVGEGDSGFRVNGLGKGFAVYSPEFLYGNWSASDSYFNEFHERVLSHASDLEVVEPAAIWPGIAATFYSGWSVGVASPDGQPVSVVAYGAANQVYQVPGGATRIGSPAAEDKTELLFPGQPAAQAIPLPIWVRPLEEDGVVTVSVVRYDETGIELLLSGTESAARVSEGEVRMVGGVLTEVEIEIRGGLYRLPPGAIQKVTTEASTMRRGAREQEMMPSPETGSLTFEVGVSQTRLLIEPTAE